MKVHVFIWYFLCKFSHPFVIEVLDRTPVSTEILLGFDRVECACYSRSLFKHAIVKDSLCIMLSSSCVCHV